MTTELDPVYRFIRNAFPVDKPMSVLQAFNLYKQSGIASYHRVQQASFYRKVRELEAQGLLTRDNGGYMQDRKVVDVADVLRSFNKLFEYPLDRLYTKYFKYWYFTAQTQQDRANFLREMETLFKDYPFEDLVWWVNTLRREPKYALEMADKVIDAQITPEDIVYMKAKIAEYEAEAASRE